MTHTLGASAEDDELAYLQRLWGIVLEPGSDLGSKVERLFEVETDEFGLEHAFFSRIDTDTQTQRFVITHGPHRSIVQGNSVPLSRSYCRRTIQEPDGTLAVSDAPAESWKDDPAYEEFDLGSYLGTTVTIDGEPYGTLCFASTEPREDALSKAERTLVQMHGQWVTYELSQWSEPPSIETLGRTIGESIVAASQIDGMMNVLAREARRIVLLRLLDDDGETTIDALLRTIDSQRAEVQLYHTHLPKLEQAGYIEWRPGSKRITRGPKYDEIQPLVHLLEEYTTGFSP